jgi:hypothetical protein
MMDAEKHDIRFFWQFVGLIALSYLVLAAIVVGGIVIIVTYLVSQG